MPITIRHDAAAVVPPSNQSTRKYGQQLVLQQNQQKYAAQQQGYDRLFTLGRDAMQSRNQAIMQGQQNAFQAARDINQNAFQAERDMARFEQQRRQQEAEQTNKFMEEARKQSSGMIMDDIKNGAYDPATSRKLQQNLVAESEALGNPQLDATQRAEALAKIRAERAMLTASRIEAPPKPTPDEEFQQGVATDPETGMRYRKNSKGDWDQLEQPQKPPASAAEAFQADPKLRDKYMADATAIVTEGGTKPLTRESRKEAATLAMELYDSDNSPPAAQPLPGAATSRGIQSATIAPPAAAAGAEKSILENPQSPPQSTADPTEAAYHTDMTNQGYMLVTPEDGGRPYYYKVDSAPQSTADMPVQPDTSWKANWDRAEAAMSDAPAPSSAPAVPTPSVPAQNPWAEVANPPTAPSVEVPAPTQAQAPVSQQSTPTPATANQQPKAPNFTSMIAGTKDVEARRVFSALQGIYQKSSPEIQAAISVIAADTSSDEEFIAARDYLRSNGIDLAQLAKYQHSGGNRKGKK